MRKISFLACLFLIPLSAALTLQSLTITPNNPIKGLLVITFSTEPLSNATVTLNNSNLLRQSQANQNSFTFTYDTPTQLIDGSYRLELTVNSTNSSTYEERYIVVDNTPPLLGYSLTTLTPQFSQTLYFNTTANDPSGIQQINLTGTRTKPFTLNGNVWTLLFTPLEVGCPPRGTCLLTLRAQDPAGNEKVETLTLTLNETSTPPQVTLHFPLPNTMVNDSFFPLKYMVNESNPPDAGQPLCTLYLYRDAQLVKKIEHSFTNYTHQGSLHTLNQRVTGLTDGPYSFNLTCTNRDLLSTTLTGFITVVDKTYPQILSTNVDLFERRAYLTLESNEEALPQIQYSSSLTNLSQTPYQSMTGTDKKFYYTFRNLQPKTLYYYQVVLEDYSHNRVTYGPHNFTTLSEETSSENKTLPASIDYPKYLDDPTLTHTTHPYLELASQETQTIRLRDPILLQIEFIPRETQPPGEILLYPIPQLPSEINPVPDRDYYTGIYLHHPSLNDQQLQNLRVRFQVDKSWLAKKEYKKESIALYRYENELWIELPTQITEEDTYHVAYTTNSPGLSLFAIAANPQEKLTFLPPNQASTPPKNETTPSSTPPPPAESPRSTWLWIAFLFLILAALSTYLYLFTGLKEKIEHHLKPQHYATLTLEGGIPASEKTPHERTPPPRHTDLPPNFHQLSAFVQKCLDRGLSPEKIQTGLEAKGWKAEHVQEAIRRCTKSKL